MNIICGIDEAGRGPLAGPVTAAAVILTKDFPEHILKDSKQMNEKERNNSAGVILNMSSDFGIGWVWPEEIDRINIHNATLTAMKRAVDCLTVSPDLVLVDGKFIPEIKYACRAIIKGDTKIKEIMAASILAKTARDKWMIRYSWIEKKYQFEKHKGYPTKEHRRLYMLYGPSPIHRKSFRVSPP